MEPKFSTSFIPKNPVTSSQVSGLPKSRDISILSVVGTLLFILAVLTSLGLFAYSRVLTGKISKAEEDLATARAQFQPEKIQELIDENSKIVASKGLLEKHVAVSEVLRLLQTLTIKRMRFSSLDYSNKSGAPAITMDGEALTYNALAQQADIFNTNPLLKSPGFQSFSLGDNGIIKAKFSAGIDPDVVLYKKLLEPVLETSATTSPEQ